MSLIEGIKTGAAVVISIALLVALAELNKTLKSYRLNEYFGNVNTALLHIQNDTQCSVEVQRISQLVAQHEQVLVTLVQSKTALATHVADIGRVMNQHNQVLGDLLAAEHKRATNVVDSAKLSRWGRR
jgi:hypothetical protein